MSSVYTITSLLQWNLWTTNKLIRILKQWHLKKYQAEYLGLTWWMKEWRKLYMYSSFSIVMVINFSYLVFLKVYLYAKKKKKNLEECNTSIVCSPPPWVFHASMMPHSLVWMRNDFCHGRDLPGRSLNTTEENFHDIMFGQYNQGGDCQVRHLVTCLEM